MGIMHPWNFYKHFLFSLTMTSVAYLIKQLLPLRESAAIGIIGGADGPTAIFVSAKFLSLNLFCAAFFTIALLLYKPVKLLIDRLRL